MMTRNTIANTIAIVMRTTAMIAKHITNRDGVIIRKRKPIKNAIKSVIAFGTKFGIGKRSVFTLLLRLRESGFELLYHTPYKFVKRKMQKILKKYFLPKMLDRLDLLCYTIIVPMRGTRNSTKYFLQKKQKILDKTDRL